MNMARHTRIHFPIGLLNPLSGMRAGGRKGELCKHLLECLAMGSLAAKPQANFAFITMAGRAHRLLLRESLASLHRSWNLLPSITIISDGSWDGHEIRAMLRGWPDEIQVLMPQQIFQRIRETGIPGLLEYAQASPFGLKLGALCILATTRPTLYADVDILWFYDPCVLLGAPESWPPVRAAQESCCYHAEEVARQFCPSLLKPPYPNAGLLTLNGPLMTSAQLEAMVAIALQDPQDGRYEQTILATAALQSGGLLPEKICYMNYEDANDSKPFPAASSGHCSRHYVNWIRHHFYTDALRLRLGIIP